MTQASQTIPRDVEVEVRVDPRLSILTTLLEWFGPRRSRSPRGLVYRADTLAGSVPVGELLSLTGSLPGAYAPQFLVADLEEHARAPQRPVTFDQQLQGMRDLTDTDIDRMLRDEDEFYPHVAGVVTGNARTAAGDFDALSIWRCWHETPRRTMLRVCSLLEQYRTTVFDSVYHGFDDRVRREADRLDAAVDQLGVIDVLAATGGCEESDDGRLRIVTRAPGPSGWQPERLILTPIAATRATRLNDFAYSGHRQLTAARFGFAYGALCTSATRATRPDPLDALLGSVRAQIVRGLRWQPASTTELSAELGYAASTISYHLKTLRQAGAVSVTRRGPSVAYSLTERGARLASI